MVIVLLILEEECIWIDSDYFTNTGWITNNTANNTPGSGGGVYTNGSHANSYFGNVS
jgi:hypothetical protein